MKTILALAIAAGFAATSNSAEDQQPVNCAAIASRVTVTAERTAADPVELLRLVDQEVSTQPDCACEIVKAAIIGTDCDDAIVGYVVETAVRAAPEHMRLIAQCAIATAPDSLARVQEVISRLDPSAGKDGESAKSAKSSKDKGIEVSPSDEPSNPLDLSIVFIPSVPPVINPRPSTPTDFRR